MQRGAGRLVQVLDLLHPRYELSAPGEPSVRLYTLPSIARRFWLARWARREFDCLTRLLGMLVHVGDTVVDVGSLYGWYAYVMARHVGSTGEVHAVEPNPQPAATIRLALGSFEQVRVHQVGAGADDATIPLSVAHHPDISSFAFGGPGEMVQATVEVPVRRLDHFAFATSPSFCKIDVEGFEPQVVRGLAGLRPRPFLFVEKPADERAHAALMELLFEGGHEFYAVPNWTWSPAVPLHRIPAGDPFRPRWPIGWSDGLAVPRERTAEFDDIVRSGRVTVADGW
jgi:FkbM family methyltransferase